MPKTPRGLSQETAPAAVVHAVAQLGANIAIARTNRQWRQKDLAAKAVVNPRVIMRIEDGRLGVGIGSYAAVLWAMGLHHDLSAIASPGRDPEGQALAAARIGERVRPVEDLDDDF